MKRFIALFLSMTSLNAFGFAQQALVQSPKALLMGNAFTAVNDDSYTLFYNPASMARHKKAFSLYPLQGHVSGTNILKDMDKFKDFPDEPVGVADLMMNYPVHASVGSAPGFKIYNFGFNLIANESYDALLRNKSHPMLDVDFKSDRGFIAGVAFPLGNDRIKDKHGSQTSIGVSAKYIGRRGIRDTIALTGPTMIDALGKNELEKVLKAIGRTEGKSWGYDVGFEHVRRSGNSQFVVGLSYLDIGNTEFKSDKKEIRMSDVDSQLNLGLAFGQKFNFFHYLLSADLQSLNQELEFNQRLKTGVEVGIGSISLLAGMNGGYYSYGAKLDLGLASLMAGFYDLEIGHHYKQTKSRRMIIYLSLFDFSFDI